MKIIDNIHVSPNVQANSYLILEPEGLTVIDTGMPFSEKSYFPGESKKPMWLNTP